MKTSSKSNWLLLLGALSLVVGLLVALNIGKTLTAVPPYHPHSPIRLEFNMHRLWFLATCIPFVVFSAFFFFSRGKLASLVAWLVLGLLASILMYGLPPYNVSDVAVFTPQYLIAQWLLLSYFGFALASLIFGALAEKKMFPNILAFALVFSHGALLYSSIHNSHNYIHGFSFLATFLIGIVLSARMGWLVSKKKGDRLILLALLIALIANHCFLAFQFTPSRLLYSEELFLSGVLLFFVVPFVQIIGILVYNSIAKTIEQQEREINSLMEISGYSKTHTNIQGLFNQLLASAVTDTQANAGWLELTQAAGEKLLKTKNVNIDMVSLLNEQIDTMGYEKEEILNIPSIKMQTGWETIGQTYQSLLAIDISINDKENLRIGLVKAGMDGFDSKAASIIKAYVHQCRTAYENNLLIEQTIQNERVKEEMEIATRIQQSLIATSFPNDDKIAIEALFEPSRMVGGDFYDHYPIDEHRFAITIGDVSGKGIPAALHMAEIKGIFQSLQQFNLEPKRLMFEANKAISACFAKNIFVTLVYVVVDRKRRTFSYARAGHSPLLYYSSQKNQAEYIEDRGMGMGIIRDDTYENHIFVYDKEYYAGDVLLLYTDGLDEATDPKTGEAFGHERLKASLEQAVRKSPDDVKKLVMADLRRYVKNNENMDDLALIAIKFK